MVGQRTKSYNCYREPSVDAQNDSVADGTETQRRIHTTEHTTKHTQACEKVFSTKTYTREVEAKAEEEECCGRD
jgi:hypothetical protein